MTKTKPPKLEVYFDDAGWLQAKPGASVKVIHDPIPEASTQALIRPYSAILHTNAGGSHTSWWNLLKLYKTDSWKTESHFQVPRGYEEGQPSIVQAMPITRRADCNAQANQWWANGESLGAISFETADEGSASLNSTPWDLGQLHAIIQTLAALSVKWNVPATLPGAWNARGIGWHALYPEWSIYKGKTCPGAARIQQVPFILSEVGRIACAASASR